MKRDVINFILLVGIPALVYAYHFFNPNFLNKYKKSSSLTMIVYFILVVVGTTFLAGCSSKPKEESPKIMEIKYEQPNWDNGAVKSLDSNGKKDTKDKK